jgi:hypothetical protein
MSATSLFFYRDRDGRNDAKRRKPVAYELIRERHGKARRMGGSDQFVGVGSLLSFIAGLEVLTLRKRTVSHAYNAFSVHEIADPSGRGVSFHEDRFQDEKGSNAPEDKGPDLSSNSRIARTRGPSSPRSAVSGVFIR